MDVHQNARTTPHSRMLIVERLAEGWTVTAVAAAMGVDAKTVRKWQLNGALPFVKLGGKLVIGGSTTDYGGTGLNPRNGGFALARPAAPDRADLWNDLGLARDSLDHPIEAERAFAAKTAEVLDVPVDASALSARTQIKAFIEEDAQEGLIKQYLETELPADWPSAASGSSSSTTATGTTTAT